MLQDHSWTLLQNHFKRKLHTKVEKLLGKWSFGRNIEFTWTDKILKVSSRARKQCNRNNFTRYIEQEIRQKSIKNRKRINSKMLPTVVWERKMEKIGTEDIRKQTYFLIFTCSVCVIFSCLTSSMRSNWILNVLQTLQAITFTSFANSNGRQVNIWLFCRIIFTFSCEKCELVNHIHPVQCNSKHP